MSWEAKEIKAMKRRKTVILFPLYNQTPDLIKIPLGRFIVGEGRRTKENGGLFIRKCLKWTVVCQVSMLITMSADSIKAKILSMFPTMTKVTLDSKAGGLRVTQDGHVANWTGVIGTILSIVIKKMILKTLRKSRCRLVRVYGHDMSRGG